MRYKKVADETLETIVNSRKTEITARKWGEQSCRDHTKQDVIDFARGYINSIIPKPKKLLFDITTKILGLAYHFAYDLRIEGLNNLESIKGRTMLMTSNHSAHADEFLLGKTLYNKGFDNFEPYGFPIIVAGNNLYQVILDEMPKYKTLKEKISHKIIDLLIYDYLETEEGVVRSVPMIKRVFRYFNSIILHRRFFDDGEDMGKSRQVSYVYSLLSETFMKQGYSMLNFSQGERLKINSTGAFLEEPFIIPIRAAAYVPMVIEPISISYRTPPDLNDVTKEQSGPKTLDSGREINNIRGWGEVIIRFNKPLVVTSKDDYRILAKKAEKQVWSNQTIFDTDIYCAATLLEGDKEKNVASLIKEFSNLRFSTELGKNKHDPTKVIDSAIVALEKYNDVPREKVLKYFNNRLNIIRNHLGDNPN